MDARGHGLMEGRAAEAWPLARGLLLSGPLGRWVPGSGGVVTTGLGSSEAQARYLALLLRRHAGVPAWFEPLSAIADPRGAACGGRERSLVVFSQGLAPNAQLALERRGDFGSVVLVTAATEAGQERAGRPERAALLRRLRGEGRRIEPFPIEDEYAILVRLVGPLCGLAAAWRLAAAVDGHGLSSPGDLVGRLDEWAGSGWPARVLEAMSLEDGAHRGGFVLATGPGLVGCGENVVAKFVEGLYWRGPRVVDLLGLAHGPLQQLVARPEPVWVLGEGWLARRAEEVALGAGLWTRRVPMPGSLEEAPLAAELLFNPVLVGLAGRLGVDQRQWPGKGMDGGLYGISRWEESNDESGA